MSSRGGDVPLLSIRDKRGAHVVLLWDDVPSKAQDAIRDAITFTPDAAVTARALTLLQLPGAPGLWHRLRLTAITAVWYFGTLVVLLLVRIWGGFWLWNV